MSSNTLTAIWPALGTLKDSLGDIERPNDDEHVNLAKTTQE